MPKILLLLAGLTFSAFSSLAQSAPDPAHDEAIRRFYTHYQNDDYKAMRKQMNWILRLVLSEKTVQGMFEGEKLMLGEPELLAVKRRTDKSVSVQMRYSLDTTEVSDMDYVFTKKNKIIGMHRASDRFVFKKRENSQVSLESKIQSIDSLFQMKKQVNFSGCLLVMNEGEVIYSNCHGYTDRMKQESLSDTSVFELASCSKQFTAVAILLLVQDGKISLQDPVVKYLPQLPYPKVTVEQLLVHSGGLPDYMELFDKHWDKTKIATNQDLVKLFAEKKPKVDFKPGERYEYSNTGYALLASIIESVSGKSYADFLQERIFTPLQMRHTRVYNTRRSGEVLSNYALGYVFDVTSKSYQLPDSLASHNYVYFLDGITGDGAVNSCIRDLALWENALRDHKLLSAEMTARAFSKAKTNDGKEFNYGYGWEIQKDGTNRDLVYHGGSWPGYINFIVHFTDVNRSVIVLTNNEYYYAPKMAKKVSAIMNR